MLSDIATTIKAQLYDRLTSPLTGAFLLAWPVWNWRFVVVLISDLKAPAKISFIENNIYTDHVTTLCYGIILPIITAVLAITVYPYVSNLFYKISQSHKKQLKGIQQRIEDETPMPLQDATELRRRFRDIQDQHDVRLGQKDLEISQIQTKNIELERMINEASQTLTSEKLSYNNSATASQNRIAQLERELAATQQKSHELEHNLTRLHYFFRFNLPTLQVIDGTAKKYFPNYSDMMAGRPEPTASIVEETIQNALFNYITGKNLLDGLNPKIYAINGTIYLRLNGPNPENYFLADYNATHYTSSIDKCKQILSTMKNYTLSQ